MTNPPRFQGTADSGAAGRTPRLQDQLSAQDLKTMTPEAIEAARVQGRLDDLLKGRK